MKVKRTLPQVTLKAAITLDGRIATASGDSKWITSDASRKLAHRMRAQADAVMVGVGTVLADDPELTVRLVRGKNPLRVVLDTQLRTPPSSKLAQASKRAPTLFLHGPRAAMTRRSRLQGQGAELVEIKLDASRRHLDLVAALEVLFARGVRKLLVEGGSELHGALLAAGLVERVAVFVAPRILADSTAKPLAAGPAKSSIAQALTLANVRYRKVGPDLLVVGALVGARIGTLVGKQRARPQRERWTLPARKAMGVAAAGRSGRRVGRRHDDPR